jgi:hypothetical protein
MTEEARNLSSNGMDAEYATVIRAPIAYLEPDLVRTAQSLKKLCLDPRKTQKYDEFCDILERFLKRLLGVGRQNLNQHCRLLGFMLHDPQSNSYKRRVFINLEGNHPLHDAWPQLMYNLLFEKKKILETFDSDYQATRIEIKELATEVIFRKLLIVRPTITLRLFDHSGTRYKKRSSIPNFYEFQLACSVDGQILDHIERFRKNWSPKADILSAAIKTRRKNDLNLRQFTAAFDYLLHNVYKDFYETWKRELTDEHVGRYRGKDEKALHLFSEGSYQLTDLFFTKIINLLAMPAGEFVYFVPADIMQSQPTGGFVFVMEKPIKDEHLLFWHIIALYVFEIIAAIPKTEEEYVATHFAHRNMGTVITLETHLREILKNSADFTDDREALLLLDGLIANLKAVFYPYLRDRYNPSRRFYGRQPQENSTASEMVETYLQIAIHLAIARLQRQGHALESGSSTESLRNAANEFRNALGLVVSVDLGPDDIHTISGEDFGVMLIQSLYQALVHSYRAKTLFEKQELTAYVPPKLRIAIHPQRDSRYLKIEISNPPSSASNADVMKGYASKDIAELQRLGRYFDLEDVFGPAPVPTQKAGTIWMTGFSILRTGG